MYDLIPRHDRFGKLIIENLKWAGIAGGGGGGNQKGYDDKHGHKDWREWLLGLEGMRTLMDQCFEVTLVRPEDWERAMRCKALDKLEEFALLVLRDFLAADGCCHVVVPWSLRIGASGVRQRWRISWDCLAQWDSVKDDEWR